MVIGIGIDDLLASSSRPIIADNAADSIGERSMCNHCKINQLPVTSNANIKLYDMASVVNISDLLTSSSRPIIADDVCSLSQGSTSECRKISDLPMTSRADVH